MVVSAGWPGASLVDTMNELTNTIEEKLEETPHIDVIKSYTTPGQTVIYVQLLDSTPPSAISDTWYQVRKKVSDIEQITFSPDQLAAIGVRLEDVMNAIAAQNAVTPAGVITTQN
jgi:multidrug efflux pump subunit AcrB